MKTAISDLEVDQREVNSKLYYIKYQIENSLEYITIATTRPETMLGDTAIAVNPKDDRYKIHVGKFAILPIVGRRLKSFRMSMLIPSKELVQSKFSAHDFNDFDVGKRHKLEIINILSEEGNLNQNVPFKYRGLDRIEARKRILEELSKLEILIKEESIKNKIPYGDRSNSIIEPYLTERVC